MVHTEHILNTNQGGVLVVMDVGRAYREGGKVTYYENM